MDRFKTYKIFLSKKPRDTNFNRGSSDDLISHPDILNFTTNDEYEFCADISARDLNEVYKLTQNTNNPWVSGENTNAVQSQYMRGARSSMVGDIFQDCENDDYYIVIPHGFENLTLSTEQPKGAKG